VQNFLKSKAFQKCTWLKKSGYAPRFRHRRSGEAAFLAFNSFLSQRTALVFLII